MTPPFPHLSIVPDPPDDASELDDGVHIEPDECGEPRLVAPIGRPSTRRGTLPSHHLAASNCHSVALANCHQESSRAAPKSVMSVLGSAYPAVERPRISAMEHTRSPDAPLRPTWSLGGRHPFAGRHGPHSGTFGLGLDLEVILKPLALERKAAEQKSGGRGHRKLGALESTKFGSGSGRGREEMGHASE